MWLKLDSEGMKIELQINNYELSNKEDWDDQRCAVDFAFKFPECIDYVRNHNGIILSCEVEMLEEKINNFLHNKILNGEVIELLEPDFVFELLPRIDAIGTGVCRGVTSENKLSTPLMKWKVNLWNGGLTDNYFSTTLGEKDLRIFRDYLRLVMGTMDVNGEKIKAYIKAEYIC